MTSYFIVDHARDVEKTEGIVESYQMVTVEVEDEEGKVITTTKRLNFVHWPNLPQPFVHDEWSEDLVFSNIYTPELDDGIDDDDDDFEDQQEYFQAPETEIAST